MIVYRATDDNLDFINKILKKENCIRYINDDLSILATCIITNPLNFLIVEEDSTPVGLFYTVPFTSSSIDVHTCIRDCKQKFKAGALGLSILKSEGFKCVTSHIPAYNSAALRYALACGFEKCGFIPESFLFNGALIGQNLVFKKLGD